MVEKDHAALESPPPEPEPASPILASQLLDLEEKQRRRFCEKGCDARVKTGCGEIDEVLGGGFERGVVVGLSAEGNEGRLISLHLLSSILLSHVSVQSIPRPKTRATVIDTTGSFPLPLLAKILKSRIVASKTLSLRNAVQTSNYGKSLQREEGLELNVDEDVERCLEMVAISRVFDIEGLWGSLGEIRRHRSSDFEAEHLESEIAESEGMEASEKVLRPETSAEINDSEEEPTPEFEAFPSPGLRPTSKDKDEDGTEIIIVDNMTHIINELFSRKEKSDSHTLLTLLSRALYSLALSQNILTILHNGTVLAKSTYPPTSAQASRQQTHPPSQTLQSIFPSNPIKPALGQIFSQFPDLHLFLSSLPKSREDAEILYGRDEDSLPLYPGSVKYCTVVEVLKDETPNLGEGKEKRWFGWREQRWTAVEISPDGLELNGAFMAKGNMRGLGFEREKIGGMTDVGNVAKIWGFGRRRV